MMKTAFVLMALAASAFAMAADPTQQTTLAPAPAQTTQAQGTTVLNAAPGQPSAVTAPNFKPAIVESPKATCGCHQEPTCDCAPKYVAPELKCETSPCGTTVGTPIAQCGCLHLEECACKRDYVAPEIADFHHAPEVVEALPSQCGCNGCTVCPVDTHVAPEIVEPTLPQQCGCTGCNPCAAIQAKAGQPGVTILKPTTTVQ